MYKKSGSGQVLFKSYVKVMQDLTSGSQNFLRVPWKSIKQLAQYNTQRTEKYEYVIMHHYEVFKQDLNLSADTLGYTLNAVNGASYGPGIYLATEPNTSLGYATNHTAIKTVSTSYVRNRPQQIDL